MILLKFSSQVHRNSLCNYEEIGITPLAIGELTIHSSFHHPLKRFHQAALTTKQLTVVSNITLKGGMISTTVGPAPEQIPRYLKYKFQVAHIIVEGQLS